jgi:hypothetical protein
MVGDVSSPSSELIRTFPGFHYLPQGSPHLELHECGRQFSVKLA